jgi:rubrerythrin
MNIDNILSKAKEVFETAYKKADGVVSTQKQKFDISSMESKLNKDFENLGRLCYDMIANGTEDAKEKLNPLIEEITAKNNQIEEMKKEVLKAKNKKLCPKCGAAVDKNAVFCNLCGVKLSEEE